MMPPSSHRSTLEQRFGHWFFEGKTLQPVGPHARPTHTTDWWKVMCLTGVDYFSTLAYQPSIAFLAAGTLAPIATLVLVVADAVRRAADVPPRRGDEPVRPGQHPDAREAVSRDGRARRGPVACWGSRRPSFVITITLSAADAAAHLVENPLAPSWLQHPVLVTIVLLLLLGAIFLRGFQEAITLAVVHRRSPTWRSTSSSWSSAAREIWRHPEVLASWRASLFAQHGNPAMMVAMALILFPKLALGLSGFETGVAVMPLVRGDATDTEDSPAGRIRNTKKLLSAAALIMSVLLMASSFVSVLLIPAEAFQPGGPADGRALAYLAHELLGAGFGTLYDVGTIAILWFAGASALAGLLNLVPLLPAALRHGARMGARDPAAGRHLHRHRHRRDARVQRRRRGAGRRVRDRRAGADELGRRRGRDHARGARAARWVAVRGDHGRLRLHERHEHDRAARRASRSRRSSSSASSSRRSCRARCGRPSCACSASSPTRSRRSSSTTPAAASEINIIANRPGVGRSRGVRGQAARGAGVASPDAGRSGAVPRGRSAATRRSSAKCCWCAGPRVDGYCVLRCKSPAIPNAIAALLLHIRDRTGKIPHVYFGWTEGNPITYLLKFLAFGEGDTAPVTREVLRQAEADPLRRPRVHVG